MYWLTEDAVLVCAHEAGHVGIVATQSLVTIDQRRVLVETDPEGRPIASCPWVGPGLLPCLLTLVVRDGYSPTIRIDGRRVCLDTIVGPTNGTPAGNFNYFVRYPGQKLNSQL